MEIVNNKNKSQSNVHKILNLDISVEIWKLKKPFLIYSTLDGIFLIPHTTLYDEYIGRRKLTEQKSPFE